MNPWHDVDKERITSEHFLSLIEVSKGSKNKYELDKETGLLILDRVLFTSTHYPQNYGFIPLTLAKDKDPLDVLVLMSEPIVPMTLVRSKPIGVMVMIDNGVPDEKIIAVAEDDPFYNGYDDISLLPSHVLEEIRHFFSVYKTLEGKTTAVLNIQGKKEAIKVVGECRKAYVEKFGEGLV